MSRRPASSIQWALSQCLHIAQMTTACLSLNSMDASERILFQIIRTANGAKSGFAAAPATAPALSALATIKFLQLNRTLPGLTLDPPLRKDDPRMIIRSVLIPPPA